MLLLISADSKSKKIYTASLLSNKMSQYFLLDLYDFLELIKYLLPSSKSAFQKDNDETNANVQD